MATTPCRYVVIVTNWSVAHSTVGVGIRIQSTRAPWHCEARVEAFLEAFAGRLAGMTAEEFAMHKDGLVVKKLERVKNLGEETSHFWDTICAGHYDFLRSESALLVPPSPPFPISSFAPYPARLSRGRHGRLWHIQCFAPLNSKSWLTAH